jgi:hypothetical protein
MSHNICNGPLTLVVGDSHRGLEKPGETHFLSEKTKHKRTYKRKTCSRQSRLCSRGPRSWRPQRPTRTVSPNHPRTKLRFARGAQHRTIGTPPRSRAGRPLGWGSASLEDWTPPRVRLRLARGPDTPSSESPPRSRLSRARYPRTCSPDQSI